MALVEGQNLTKKFSAGGMWRRKKVVHAVSDVNISVKKGETLGLVGESGCGKSTLGLMLLRLVAVDEGRVIFDGKDITDLSMRSMRTLRRRMQIIFQDPYSSLNPRFKVRQIVEEPFIIHGFKDKKQRQEKVLELLDMVGLPKSASERYPHEFSGGQRQRIGIARAIALHPDFIVADEAVSALDVSVRGGILNLMADLKEKFGFSYLFISHDLNVIEHVSDKVAVMYLGRIVEILPKADFDLALHPYTKALASAVPVVDPVQRRKRIILGGEVPSPYDPPAGCPFHPRCPLCFDRCKVERPELLGDKDGRFVACHKIELKEVSS